MREALVTLSLASGGCHDPNPSSLYRLSPTLPSVYQPCQASNNQTQTRAWPNANGFVPTTTAVMIISCLSPADLCLGQRLLLLPCSLSHHGNFHKKETSPKQRRGGVAQRWAGLTVFNTLGWKLSFLPLHPLSQGTKLSLPSCLLWREPSRGPGQSLSALGAQVRGQ